MASIGRVLIGISVVLFLIGAIGHLIGLTGNPQIVLFWGLAFFAAGHIL